MQDQKLPFTCCRYADRRRNGRSHGFPCFGWFHEQCHGRTGIPVRSVRPALVITKRKAGGSAKKLARLFLRELDVVVTRYPNFRMARKLKSFLAKRSHGGSCAVNCRLERRARILRSVANLKAQMTKFWDDRTKHSSEVRYPMAAARVSRSLQT